MQLQFNFFECLFICGGSVAIMSLIATHVDAPLNIGYWACISLSFYLGLMILRNLFERVE